MDVNKLIKNTMWGVSAVVGIIVAEGVYRAATSAMDKRELIGDIKPEDVKEVEEFAEDDLPF